MSPRRTSTLLHGDGYPARAYTSSNLNTLVPWIKVTLVVAGLYVGRAVAVPLILAVLLSFMLSPIVAALKRARTPRGMAVALAVILALGVTALTTSIIASQAATLSADAPAYAQRISAKAASIRDGIRSRLGGILNNAQDERTGDHQSAGARRIGAAALREPQSVGVIPVEVRPPPPTALEDIQSAAMLALGPVETTLIVVVVCVFILLRKEDLRDRLIRLMGARDLHRTTRALDDAARRLSRYFLSQFVVNCGFGAIVWGALMLIGVPSPGLWGIVAGLLRFVPYIGTVLAALGPLALAAAVDPGWTMAIYVALLFAILEPLIGYVIEPVLYGRSTGISSLAVVVAAVFWTWIWGPVGLVLSMPLTLLLVVLGRHVPGFQVFDVLLGDRPALSPSETFYQRILAGHPDEAIEQADELLTTMTIGEYYDDVILDALRMAANDLGRGAIDRATLVSACEIAAGVVHGLADHPASGGGLRSALAETGSDVVPAQPGPLRVICISTKGPSDGVVTTMLVQMLQHRGCIAREEKRDFARAGVPAPSVQGAADLICLSGLVDPRAFGRLERVANQIALELPHSLLAIGVKRAAGDPDVAPSEGSKLQTGLYATLTAMADSVLDLGIAVADGPTPYSG